MNEVAVFTGSGAWTECEGVFKFDATEAAVAFEDGVSLGAGLFGGDECCCYNPAQLADGDDLYSLGAYRQFYLEALERREIRDA